MDSLYILYIQSIYSLQHGHNSLGKGTSPPSQKTGISAKIFSGGITEPIIIWSIKIIQHLCMNKT